MVQGKALDTGFDLNGFAPAGIGYAYVAYSKGANAEQLLADVRHFLKRKLKDGLSAELVKAARVHEIAQAEFQKNSISGLAMAWSQALAIEGRQSPQQDIDAIKQVTLADVDRVARKYLDLKHAVTVVLAPAASGTPVASKGFGGRESFATSKVKAVSLPKWASSKLQKVSIPHSNVHPVDMKLPNGIRLIVQPTRVSATVSVYGHIRNRADMEEPRGQEGVNLVLGQLFGFGTHSMNRLQFEKALDDIAADESAGTSFSVQVLRAHFDRGVQLLADNELHPALPAGAFRIVRHQLAGYLAGRNASPGYLVSRAVRASLFKAGDPTLRQATPKTVRALTLKDVQAYFKHVYRPDLTTIVVIGDVTPRQARATIEKYFGAWKAHGAKPQTLLPPVALSKQSTTTVPDRSRVQDKVVEIETLGLKRSNPDYYALQLGNHVLGGGFYSTRLYQDLRENTGLVYYVSSAFQVGKTRAIYQVSYACDPPNVSRASAIINRDLKAMQATLVTPAELHNARASLLRAIPLSESSTNSIAMGLLDRATRDLPLNEPLIAAKYYAHLSAADIKQAFAKWVRPKALAQIVQGPAPH
ncbi:MAG: insulinase family protein [Gammaproteobacteria bacterium]